jgi:hypothetical protein
MPTPTPMATPWVAAGVEVGEVLPVPVGPEEEVVVPAELVVELAAAVAVYDAEGLMVVTMVPAWRVKTALGSEQLQPL